jgi:hypothetical protein
MDCCACNPETTMATKRKSTTKTATKKTTRITRRTTKAPPIKPWMWFSLRVIGAIERIVAMIV